MEISIDKKSEQKSPLCRSSDLAFKTLNTEYSSMEPDQEEVYVYWTTSGSWSVQAEVFTEDGIFLQRKTIAKLKENDFFLLSNCFPETLRLYVQAQRKTRCFFSPLSKILVNCKDSSQKEYIVSKITSAMIRLTEFEKEVVKPNLIRPLILEESGDFRLLPNQLGFCASKPVWVKGSGYKLTPRQSGGNLISQTRLLHPNIALKNEGDYSMNLSIFSNHDFCESSEFQEDLVGEVCFQWDCLVYRWQDHFRKKTLKNDDHLERNNIYSQSIKYRLLNLVRGKKSYLPKTKNLTLKATFFLIEKIGATAVLPRVTEGFSNLDMIRKIAESSSLIVRESRLSGEWWNSDHGSFLSWDINEKPYVLIFGKKGYVKWCPDSEKLMEISSEELAEFSNRAVYIFNQFPAKPLTLADLILFDVRSVKLEIIFVLIIAALMSGLVALIPMFSAFVVNDLLPSALINLLFVVCGGFAVLGVFKSVFTFFDSILAARINQKLTLSSHAALWHRVLNFPMRVSQKFPAGDIAMRMGSLSGMQQFFRSVAQNFVTMLFQILTSLCVVLWVNFELGMGVLAFGLVAILASVGFSYWQIKAFMGGEKSIGIVNSFVLEIYAGIHKIKFTEGETQAMEQWAERYGRLKQKMIASQKVGILHNSFQIAWISLSTALVYWLIINFTDVKLEAAMFVAFIGAFAVFSANLSSICSIVVQAGMQIPMFKFIKPLLDNIPENKVNLFQPNKLIGNIKVEEISFIYPGQMKMALSGVSFEVKQGEFVVIAGKSGSGKSTLSKLMSGLERPRSGFIFLDDYELHTLDNSILHSCIAVVPQDFRLLGGTLYENIKGASNATMEEIIEAAKVACIWDDIVHMPMELHTLTHSNHGAFSGGQIQRIAMARALVRKPKILIMDEATSAVDNKIQNQVIENLKAINCTVLWIAHRLRIAEKADKVILFADGKLADQGSHNDLINKNQQYAKICSFSQI